MKPTTPGDIFVQRVAEGDDDDDEAKAELL